MAHEVYAFGDSHWRLFFPTTNHGAPGICHEQNGIVTLDTTANELAGATMWGLQNPNSRHGARNRILNTIDERGGVENVGLVFGEVDVRYHFGRYLYPDGSWNMPKVLELLTVYRKFIDEELILPGRVSNKVFVYYGFRYGSLTPHPHSEPVGVTMTNMHRIIEHILPYVMACSNNRIITICPGPNIEDPYNPGLLRPEYASDDGVHPLPETVFKDFVFPVLERFLNG